MKISSKLFNKSYLFVKNQHTMTVFAWWERQASVLMTHSAPRQQNRFRKWAQQFRPKCRITSREAVLHSTKWQTVMSEWTSAVQLVNPRWISNIVTEFLNTSAFGDERQIVTEACLKSVVFVVRSRTPFCDTKFKQFGTVFVAKFLCFVCLWYSMTKWLAWLKFNSWFEKWIHFKKVISIPKVNSNSKSEFDSKIDLNSEIEFKFRKWVQFQKWFRFQKWI